MTTWGRVLRPVRTHVGRTQVRGPPGAQNGLQRLYAAAMSTMITEATITCPECSFAKAETMPTDACRYIYVCDGCGTELRPKAGDCCVFCSYADQVCPPKQAGQDC